MNQKLAVTIFLLSLLVGIQVRAEHNPPIVLAADGPVVSDPASALGSLIPTLGVSGVLVWYLWYNESTAKPKMREVFAVQLEAERKYFTEQLEQERKYNSDQMDKACKVMSDVGVKMDRMVEHCSTRWAAQPQQPKV